MVEAPRSGAASDAEDALMIKLRSLAGQDPQQIIRLAREANARDPDGPNAPERAWMVVKSLTDLQRFSEAKDEAQAMVNRYPGTSWALDVQRHLLSNPL
jgi:TolA-binding protein